MRKSAPNYDLEDVKRIVEKEAIDFEYNAGKDFEDLCDALGFTVFDACRAILNLKQSDFHKSIKYDRINADVYKTLYLFSKENEWGEVEIDKIPLYIKLAISDKGGLSRVVLLLSFKQE